MQVINKANDRVAQVWGKQKIKDTKYRLIQYSLVQEVEEGLLVYNLVSGEMVLLEGMKEWNVEALSESDYQALVEKRFLVPEDYNELKMIRQLRKICHTVKNQSRKGITGYTIMPTSHCNARCFYCFEANFPYHHMSEETANKLVEYMVKNCDEKKKVKINWFGGEPTVGATRIDQICRGLQENGIEYSSFMYSNGYLLDEEMVKKAKELWKLNRIQITLDGTEEVYNKAKAYKSVTGSPYRVVLQNIKHLLDADIQVSIRLNMDAYNYEDLKNLIAELGESFSVYKKIRVYVSVLFENEGFEKISHSNDEQLELEKKKKELTELIREKKLSSSNQKSKLPCLRSSACQADNDHSRLINPKGQIAKCDHMPDEMVFGDIYSGSFDTKKYLATKEVNEYELCKECSLFPICNKLKICADLSPCNEIRMNDKKEGLLNTMVFVYKKYCEEKNGGESNEI
ncbi:MAG: radical SAM protein [Bacillota bacterium]|nr:radical SAM protein [Bacillota bacterium]